VSILDNDWLIYVGDTWIGTLAPTGSDDDWYYADFTPGDGWGNFAPWFQQAVEAHKAGNDNDWNSIYSQLLSMGLTISADNGESYNGPTLHIDGSQAWFVV